MIKALVSIDADLPSSIALRYTCQLARLIKMEIQTIHVHEQTAAGPGIGAGWARHTWEKEMVEEGKKEISQLLTAESDFCPILKEPIVVPGDHEKEILTQLRTRNYDIFVEGRSSTCSANTLAKKMKSHLYQHIPMPSLLVQNLLPLGHVTLAVEEEKDLSPLMDCFSAIFGGLVLELEVISLARGESGHLEGQSRKFAERHNWRIRKTFSSEEALDVAAEEIENSDLIATVLERSRKGSNPMLEFLTHTRCPLFFCWK
jgi:hypothetical protein